MTRNNLKDQISWLLSSKVTLPEGVPARVPTISTAVIDFGEPDLAELEALEQYSSPTPSPAASPIQHYPIPRPVTANFARPPIPAPVVPISQPRENAQSFGTGSMGKPATNQRTIGQGLMSQHQLATPASTTSTTASSSLRQGYSNLLRERNGQ